MITTYSSRDYRITYQGIALIENALERPDLVQVSVVSGCTILVAPQKEYGIDYEPNGEYRYWYMEGMNTRLVRAEAHYIYVRLNRNDKNALLLFSVNDYDTDGKINGEGAASEDYYYIKIGDITKTDSVENPTLDREITIDFGYLSTPAGQDDTTAEWRELFEVTAEDLIRPLKNFTSFVVKGTLSIIGKIVLNDKQVSDVAREGDEGDFNQSDEAVPTTKLLMGKYLAELRKLFLNKDREDSTDYVQTFKKGIKVGKKYTPGLLGTGGAIYTDENDNTHAEFDFLNIRKKALFTEISVQELKHVGGSLIISPAAMVITLVEEIETGYKCYFNRSDSDGKTVYNEFEADDQGRCQTFNLEKQANGQVGNRYWWRLVTEVGEDYVVFSKTDADTGSDIPAAGDEVSQLGNRTDKTRQNAQIYSAYGPDAPSRKMYQGIDSYSLVDKEVKSEYFDPITGRFREVTYGDFYKGNREETNYIKQTEEEGLHVKGKVDVEAGSSGVGNFTDLPDEIEKAVKIGGENLLLNSGFTGNYKTVDLTAATKLKSDTELYSPNLDKWDGTATVTEEPLAQSKFACQIGNISQQLSGLIPEETYSVGLYAKGTSLTIQLGETAQTLALTAEYQRYTIKMQATATDSIFRMNGDAVVYDTKLERGTVATDWCPNVNDASEIADRFKYLRYIQDALKSGTDIIGGLILSTIIQLGKYTDGKMEKVNAGISGIYNDDRDVAVWSGGTFEQAIATVQKLTAGEQPTDEEWKSLAKFVATHGGDIFLRGYIYALGGVFRGTVYASGGEFNGKITSSINGNRIVIDPATSSLIMYDKYDNECAKIMFSSDEPSHSTIVLTEYGGYNNDIPVFNAVISGRASFWTSQGGESVLLSTDEVRVSKGTTLSSLTKSGLLVSDGSNSTNYTSSGVAQPGGDSGKTEDVLLSVDEFNLKTYMVFKNGLYTGLKYV